MSLLSIVDLYTRLTMCLFFMSLENSRHWIKDTTCKGDAASWQLKPSFTGIQTTIHHLIATGRQMGEVEAAIRPKFCFLGRGRCWAIKPTKSRDPHMCSLWDSQLLPDACLLMPHKSLGCINQIKPILHHVIMTSQNHGSTPVLDTGNSQAVHGL